MNVDNEILQFIHCRQCISELPDDMSPRDFAQFEVGLTQKGLQVWCSRHEINVANYDFTVEPIAVDTSI